MTNLSSMDMDWKMTDLRERVRRMGDGSCCPETLSSETVNLRQGKFIVEDLIKLLADSDVNVRIGACRITRNMAPILNCWDSDDLFKLRKALDQRSMDISLNDYSYEDQLGELDVITVADEAKAALKDLGFSR